MKMFCGKKKLNILLFFGVFFILLGVILLICLEDFLKKIVRKKFELSENSKTYDPWVKSQVPIYVKYYFFNWTNAGDLKEANYKPEFAEVGPYKFWEKIEKVNVTWNRNGTVSYRRIRRWYFDPKDSNGTLADRITTINTIALMAARLVKTMPLLSRIPLNMMIASTQKIAVTKTVSEFLFEGYVDPLLTAGRRWPPVSSKVPYDKFGWFYKRNESFTFDGVYNVETGGNGMEFFGSVSLWNYRNQTGFYSGKCGQVKGSGGEFWPWNLKKNSMVYLFSPDLCRYIEYKFSEEVTIDGIDGFKYVADSGLFDNGTLDSANKCFCNGQCLAAGVMNISVCRFGAPVFTSYPHFYLADPLYVNAVVGMKPRKSLHENYLLLEPNYGMPMDIAARIQINVFVQPDQNIALLEGVKKLIFPVLWLDQRVTVSSARLFVIRLLKILPSANFVFSIAFITLGVTLLLCFARGKVISKKKAVKISSQRNSTKKKENFNFNEESGRLLNDGKKRKILYPEIKSVKFLGTDL